MPRDIRQGQVRDDISMGILERASLAIEKRGQAAFFKNYNAGLKTDKSGSLPADKASCPLDEKGSPENSGCCVRTGMSSSAMAYSQF